MMEHGTYFSYLLRMWQVLREDKFVWMATLDDSHTGERRSFTSMQELYAFLSQYVEGAGRPNQSGTGSQADPGVPNIKGEN